jgi:hypothetical protein
MVGEPDATVQVALNTFNWCRSTAFSASSRNVDLNGEAKTLRKKQSNPIIPPA